jgi:hypothetical protein
MKKMKILPFGILFGSTVLLIPGCKSTYSLSDESKSTAQNMTPEVAAVKLSAIIIKDKTSASIGLDDVVTGGLTRVTKDSVTYYKTLGPQADKAANGFTGGYSMTPAYSEAMDLVITVDYRRVKSINVHELKNGDLSIMIKDSQKSFLTKTMYQFETPGTNRQLVFALCSVLMPNATFVYKGGTTK